MYDLVAITGAGISKASGIPTFEDMGDLRNKLTRSYFNSHPEEFYQGLLAMKETIDRAEPNPAHLALVEYNIPVITMNIDGLHTRAGSKDLIEVHGNLDFVSCSKCKNTYDFYQIRESIKCSKCGRILESNVVLYGDMIKDFREAIKMVDGSKHILVVGTSFYTSTVNDLVYRAKLLDIGVDVINQSAETELSKYLKKMFG